VIEPPKLDRSSTLLAPKAHNHGLATILLFSGVKAGKQNMKVQRVI
jgi:hypothetical protein